MINDATSLDDISLVERVEDTQCLYCCCVVKRNTAVCGKCVRNPLGIDALDHCSTFVNCENCDIILCPFHATHASFENRLCVLCSEGYSSQSEMDSDDSDDEDSEELDPYLHNVLQSSFNEAPIPKRRRLEISHNTNVYKREHVAESTDTCPICMEVLKEEIAVMLCHPKHNFHVGCIDQWLHEYSASCPICQHKFSE